MPTIDLAAAMAADSTPVARQMSLSELAAAFYARNPTATGEERLRKWLAAIGEEDAWTTRAETFERLAEHMLEAGYKASSVNRDLNQFGTVYRWAKRQRYTPRGFLSPTLAVRRFTDTELRRVHLTPEQLEAIRAGSILSRSPGFGAFVNALADSGARKSEVLERSWGDVDLEAGTIEVVKTKTDVPRILFLQPRTVTLLRRLAGPKLAADRLLFPGRYPEQPRDYRRPWSNLTRDVGLPKLRMHDLRHVRAAELLRAGVTLGVAAQVLGHSPEILSRRYGHLETAALRDAIERSWRNVA